MKKPALRIIFAIAGIGLYGGSNNLRQGDFWIFDINEMERIVNSACI